MSQLKSIRDRQFDGLQRSLATIEHVIHSVTREEATTWRDGPDGWTVLEVLCHLRDYDVIFLERGTLMLEHERPHLPNYDHLAMVVDKAYNEQDITAVYHNLAASRQNMLNFFAGLSESDWARSSIHPNIGDFGMSYLVTHVLWHDVNHIEQMMRIIREGRKGM